MHLHTLPKHVGPHNSDVAKHVCAKECVRCQSMCPAVKVHHATKCSRKRCHHPQLFLKCKTMSTRKVAHALDSQRKTSSQVQNKAPKVDSAIRSFHSAIRCSKKTTPLFTMQSETPAKQFLTCTAMSTTSNISRAITCQCKTVSQVQDNVHNSKNSPCHEMHNRCCNTYAQHTELITQCSLEQLCVFWWDATALISKLFIPKSQFWCNSVL